MTTNKYGSVNQKPLYGCTSCYEEYTWHASDLRVYDSECWCDTCWDGRSEEFPDQPSWNDLEPYTPALQAEREKLVEALAAILEHDSPINIVDTATATERDIFEIARAVLAARRKQGGEK